MSKTLKTFGYTAEQMIPTLTNVGDAGAALGMSTDDINVVATAIGRMKSTDKGSLEYLNMLSERGIDAVGYIAQDKGVSKGDVYDMISKGDIGGEYVSSLITQKMQELFGGAMEAQSQTYSGLVSTKEGWQDEMDAAYGEGYNETRKGGIQEQIEYLGGAGGDALKKANEDLGAFQASLENMQEELNRGMTSAVMGVGDVSDDWSQEAQDRVREMQAEYANITGDSEEAAAARGKLIKEAEILAQSEYNASEGAQIMRQSEISLIDSVRNDSALNEAYYDAGYTLGQSFDKGRAAATLNTTFGISTYKASHSFRTDTTSSGNTSTPKTATTKTSRTSTTDSGGIITQEMQASRYLLSGYAYGLDYVPYNGYPALLHEGERVLTASQARQADDSGGVVVSGNNFYIREEADVQKVAQELLRELQIARAAAKPRG